MSKFASLPLVDIFIIGGGINGCGIARDAAGRGLQVQLAEMNDLASGTSSSSTKLLHGGLRYLEFFEFRLVREALIERENLLVAMPHISWPMRFVLPYHHTMRFEGETPTSRLMSLTMPWLKGRRPSWLIRLGLFIYDHLGGRKLLAATSTLDLSHDPAGDCLNGKLKKAYEYSDCWVDDSRLVVLNARDAQARGAEIMTRTQVVSATRCDGVWNITLEDSKTKKISYSKAKVLVNAGGPWVQKNIVDTLNLVAKEAVRLVRGSHIVVAQQFDHGKSYFFQGDDGRIVFAIPYETDFTLIGTTDIDHTDVSITPECTTEEIDYLLTFTANFFKKEITKDSIIWSYSGIRPLYDDGAQSASQATRDYVLSLDTNGGETGDAPLLNIFGGKITTYRRLAESALNTLSGFFPRLSGHWTRRVALPGGDFAYEDCEQQKALFQRSFPMIEARHAHRLFRCYGLDAFAIFAGVETEKDVGANFGHGIYARELDWAVNKEWVACAEDFLWRRTKQGLHTNVNQVTAIEQYLQQACQQASATL